jgi:hypothetical protein
LGLGVLSVAPSTAAVSSLTVTAANGTSANSTDGGASDSTTAATISISALIDNPLTDSITVTFVKKSVPSTSVAVPFAYFVDSTTSAANSTYVDSLTAATPVAAVAAAQQNKIYKASTGDTYTRAIAVDGTAQFRITKGTSAGYVGATFAVQLDSMTARVAGTYTYTAIVKSWTRDASGNPSATTTTQDLSIVVAAAVASSTTVAPASTTAFIGATTGPTTDAAVSAVATNDSTVDAYIQLNILNAAGATDKALDSVTASVSGPGLISFDGTTYGKSIKVASTGSQSIRVLADGTAGVSTISISTLSGFSTTKSVTFYAKSAKTITAAVASPVLAVGANTGAVSVSAVDANGTPWTGQAYIVASTAADALVAGSATTPVACAAWNSTDGILCDVTAIAAGTAKFTVIDASTVALATATSNVVTVTVSAASLSAVKIAFDKATYQPYEKATITVTPVDSTGGLLPAAGRANVLATGGITSDISFGSLSDTLTATFITTSSTTGVKKYTVYMPAQGTVTITATGGTALSLAGQVAITAKATVTNASVDAATDAANEATDAANAATDAALAAADAADAATAAAQDASDAVAALSASVEKLVASLKAQLTSLTNLVIKIQKKVKA